MAWDKNEVDIEAVKTAPDQEDLDKITVEINASPSSVSIETKHANKWFGNSKGKVTYKIHVPAGLRIKKASCVNSTMTIEGVQGSINASTVNGSLHVTGVRSEIDLHSVNGSVEAKLDSIDIKGDVKLGTVNGSCELSCPENMGAKLDLSTVNGRTKCEFPVTISNSSRHNLKGTIGNGTTDIRMSSVNGSVSISKN